MDYDFAIIGGGSAGYAAARTATAEGLRTVVIEGGDEIAGLCILRGCMPSKTLLESANRAMTIRRAAEFGLHAENFSADPAAIIARKRRLIAEFASYRADQLENGDFELIRGQATFIDAHTLEVRERDGSSRTLTTRTALISTGSVISTPPVPGLADCDALTSDDVLDLERFPASVVVLGAGPVALELAYYLHAVGVPVTIIQRSAHVLSWFDPELADVVTDAYRELGITVYTGTEITGIECDDDGKHVHFLHAGREQTVKAESILNGLGRRPNVEPLHLERAGFDPDQRSIDVRPTMQSTVDSIFAAGDVCGPYEIVHLAIAQGELAARNAARLLRDDPAESFEKMDYRLVLFGVFTEPQVAAVGLSESAAAEQGIDVITASYPFDDHGKSMVMGETHGCVKLLANPRTGELLGGACVGPHAAELIHEIVVAMAFRSTAAQLAAVPHYHPTLSEIWTYPAEDLAERVG